MPDCPMCDVDLGDDGEWAQDAEGATEYRCKCEHCGARLDVQIDYEPVVYLTEHPDPPPELAIGTKIRITFDKSEGTIEEIQRRNLWFDGESVSEVARYIYRVPGEEIIRSIEPKYCEEITHA